MANPLAKTLIGIAAALAIGVPVSAQDDALFREAVRLIRTNQPEEGLAKLREYVASNPGDEAAFELWSNTEGAVWQMLLAREGEFETIARLLMTNATRGRSEISRDEERISDLVATATTSKDHGARGEAQAKLAGEHAEFAVQALVDVLANADEDEAQNLAILALQKIGSPATLPLIEALHSDSDLVRRNVAIALKHIGDPRAAAAMARLAASDSNESVREIGRRGMAKFGVSSDASIADLYVRDARDYLTGVALRGYGTSEVVWTWEDGKLVSHDVPSTLYHFELAKQSAHEAMRMDPGNDAAKSLLARSYLGQAATIEQSIAANPDDEEFASLAGKVGSLKMVAMTLSVDTLRRALTESIRENMGPVAIAAAEALGQAESRKSLPNSPLLGALKADDRGVRYAAALSIAKISGDSASMPRANEVVAVLGQAVEEEGRRLVKVIGGGDIAKAAAMNASGMRGIAVNASLNANDAVADILAFPNYDIVVIDANLSGQHPRAVIDVIKSRAPNAKILLSADSEDAGEEYGDLIDGVIAGGFSGEALVEKANELVQDLDPRRTKANAVALAASNALASLGGKVDINGALGSLAAQLDRGDDIAIPAAHALGAGGNLDNVPALAAVVSGDGSTEVRVAAANAVGDILARSDSVPGDLMDAMKAIASNGEVDLALRQAVVTALGKGKLAPGERLSLANALATIAQSE